MRRQYFGWMYIVLAFVLTFYGGFMIIYNLNHDKAPSILSIVFFCFGVVLFIIYLVLLIITLVRKKKAPVTVVSEIKKEEVEEFKPEVKEEVKKEESTPKVEKAAPRSDVVYERKTSYTSRSSSCGGSAYIKKVGYGPVIRVNESQILDMRTNTYYRLQGNIVHQEGSGPVYEISGNRIRSAFGGYLYEISGSSINKVYGGYYASLSGGYITLVDLSEKYEITDSLSTKQILAVVALLFGEY